MLLPSYPSRPSPVGLRSRRPRISRRRVAADKERQRPAREGDRCVRGYRVQQIVQGGPEVRGRGQGRDPGRRRDELPARRGGQGRGRDQALRGYCVGEALGEFQEPYIV